MIDTTYKYTEETRRTRDVRVLVPGYFVAQHFFGKATIMKRSLLYEKLNLLRKVLLYHHHHHTTRRARAQAIIAAIPSCLCDLFAQATMQQTATASAWPLSCGCRARKALARTQVVEIESGVREHAHTLLLCFYSLLSKCCHGQAFLALLTCAASCSSPWSASPSSAAASGRRSEPVAASVAALSARWMRLQRQLAARPVQVPGGDVNAMCTFASLPIPTGQQRDPLRSSPRRRDGEVCQDVCHFSDQRVHHRGPLAARTAQKRLPGHACPRARVAFGVVRARVLVRERTSAVGGQPGT